MNAAAEWHLHGCLTGNLHQDVHSDDRQGMHAMSIQSAILVPLDRTLRVMININLGSLQSAHRLPFATVSLLHEH